ncbi:PQQ-binding-like beta-propeller repeat protein [Streptomonospora litoralis]|uniref:Uncharacterized protein n=1 Tax=Streptomonospora litoralis TaxID=2498135 RepID=A0A4P6Q240_9ACTN|nr:hypothetical protein [Streptomonospora litoralis]QBI54678.1 hypothetical protein EKD16_14485 [Streptomonospora litoralis]
MTEANGAAHHSSPVVLVVSADERSAEVTIERHTRTVFGDTPKQTRNAALDLAADYAAHLGHSVLVNARDANGAWQLIVSPTGVVRAAGGTEVALMARSTRPKRARRVVLAAVGGVLTLAVVAGGAVAAVRYVPGMIPEQRPTPEQPAVTLDARKAPPGFTRQAAWRLPMHEQAQPDVASDGNRLAYVDPGGRLRVVGRDGEPLWTADLPLSADEVVGAPRFVRVGGRKAVAVVGGAALWLWPPDGGDPQKTALPEGAEVSYAGGGPLVIADGRASIPADGGLASVQKPGGTGALLSDGERVLTAVVRGPWIWVAPDGSRQSVQPQAPEGADALREIYTAGGGYVVASWSMPSGDRVVLALHDWSDGSVVAAAETTAEGLDDAGWAYSADVAGYGPLVADTQAGRAKTAEGFDTVSAAGDTVFGEVGGAAVAATAGAEPIELEGDVARPWGLLGERAVVVSDDDLFALVPE